VRKKINTALIFEHDNYSKVEKNVTKTIILRRKKNVYFLKRRFKYVFFSSLNSIRTFIFVPVQISFFG